MPVIVLISPITLTLVFISVALLSQTIRGCNALPDPLLSSAEGKEDGVDKFTTFFLSLDSALGHV